MTFLETFVRPHYRITESKSLDLFTIKWDTVAFPKEFIWVGVLLLVFGFLILVYRKKISLLLQNIRFIHRQWVWTSLAYFIMFLGIISFVNSISDPPKTVWEVSPKGLYLQFPESAHTISWENLVDVRWDTSKLSIREAPLVLTQKDGKKLWLAINWLLQRDRIKLIKKMRKWDSEAVQPAIEGKTLKN